MATFVQRQQPRHQVWIATGLCAAVAGVVVGRIAVAGIPDDRATPLVMLTHLYALVLAVGLLWLAAGVGHVAIRALRVPVRDEAEGWIFAVGLGFGVVAYTVLALGLLGLLRPLLLAVVLSGLALLARHDLIAAVRAARALLSALLALRRQVRQQAGGFSFVVPLTEVLAIVLLATALAPPTGYDALMYHLQGPKRFLDLGRIAMLPDVQQANMPLTVDLLYLISLALGSDEAPQVLHLLLALTVAAAIYSFGRQFVSERVGLVATIIFLSSPMVAVFATMANIDFGLTLFDFLAVYAFVRWLREQDGRFLLLAGLLAGFALGSKYHGGITGVVLGLWLVVTAWRLYGRSEPSRALLLILMFAVPAGLVACPWYVKNLLWLGSPIWPLLAPGPQAYNIAISANVDSGRTPIDYLMLPFRSYFGAAHEYALARPPLLLWLLPAYLIVRRHRIVTGLLALATVHVVVWVQGPHVLRYLMQSLPELCLGAAYVLTQLAPRLAIRPGRSLADPILVGALAISVTVAIAMAAFNQPFAQLIGAESRESFLNRQLPNHRLVAALNRQGEAVHGVLLIGDRRAFHVDAPNWVDVSLGALETLGTAPDADAARAYLEGLGVSHVLVSAPDVAWHTQYDPDDRIKGWWNAFERTRGGYLATEATYYELALYRVVDRPGVASAEAEDDSQGGSPD